MFGIWTLSLQVPSRREEGALGGLEICCGARAVQHFPALVTLLTLSHLPSFSDGQSHRQTLQLPSPGDHEL